jgi:hypothetical protein
MIELVSFNYSKLSFEFVKDEFISFIPVTVIENNRMTKVHSIRKEIRDRKNLLDMSFDRVRHILAKKNRGFLEIWSLA